MNRLESSKRRFEAALAAVDKHLSGAAKAKADARKGLDLLDRVEKRAETAIKQLRDIIRQGEGSSHG
ncbi:hypothetical protein [Parvularcula lutaonensis]|uniref:Uncharacterized protein n=1 Tax=Parvularcula lutaonensis TaxID=491923 RepID=A0ABV7M9C9_9PROT|nr:hypothetical protein [Parvularcula lutaonensis]GGY45021.1 hypothetical protein GCM10007148_12480 [Parvularcula lutaonensis]